MEAVAPTGKHCSPDSEAIGVLTSSIGGVACLHFGAGMLVPLQGAAAWCCLRVLLSEWCARFRAGMLCRCRVPLLGAAARCCLRVLLLYRWCVRFGAGMLVPLQGAAARCCLSVLLSECCRVPLQGAAVGAACLGALTAAPCTSLAVPKMQTIFCSGTRQGDQQPSSKSTHSILTAWQPHQQLQKRTCQTSAPSSSNLLHPAAAPCSGTLQRHPAATSAPLSPPQQHPEVAFCCGTLQRYQQALQSAHARHLAVAPAGQLETAHAALTAAAAPCSGTSRQAPKRTGHSNISTLQRHLAVSPACQPNKAHRPLERQHLTSRPAPKRTRL